jgi:hypothetical protein
MSKTELDCWAEAARRAATPVHRYTTGPYWLEEFERVAGQKSWYLYENPSAADDAMLDAALILERGGFLKCVRKRRGHHPAVYEVYG